jgi:esterase/lipase superfamily enzyme
MRVMVVLVAAAALVLAGCTPRGAVTIDRSAAGVGSVERILVATSRTVSTGPEIYGRERSATLGFARLDVSVPPDRAPGTLTFPDDLPADPRTDFLTVDATLAPRPPDERRILVFVHGFNTNFAEGVYRQAQMLHDFGTPAIGVHYSWPSAADARLYLYDRDSAFYARDGLERLLRLLADSDADRIVVVGHSMGAQVTLEALRQMALTGAPRFFDKLTAVALLSPDVDVDLFRSELTPLATMDIPWIIFVSSHDRALRVSSLLRGRLARLGSLSDPTAIADLDVTIIDMSAVEGDPLGHSVVASSPVMISLVQGLSQYGPTILAEEEQNTGLAATTIQAVQQVTEVVVSPLAPLTPP